ncbi:MAG: cysteate synthase [Elainellaceae cyanobacterium]
MPNHILRCTLCGAEYAPDPFRLQCDRPHAPSLLRAIYSAQTLNINPDLPGVFRYADWLPVERWLDISGKPITYQSEKLAAYLGLSHLMISFNGYFPERGAALTTCSFKELEAPPVLARIPAHHSQTLVIASAGNTGRAFANVCSALQMPLCLVIPERNLSAIWSANAFHPNVRLIGVSGDGDYSDAIALGRLISQMDGFFPEGGAANVARRDGMGVTMIDAAATLGRIPDHYVQAVGSGTGGISAWEANLRLLADGRFGTHRMKLHLAQNAPFTPMVDAWAERSPEISIMNEAIAKSRISQVSAQVLTNRQPAYSLAGGLYDALADTNGEMYAVTNEVSDRARQLFETLEGIDISPASGIATAALMQAIATGAIPKNDCVLLNITSGGIKRMQRDYPLQTLTPTITFTPDEITPERVARRIETWRTLSPITT